MKVQLNYRVTDAVKRQHMIDTGESFPSYPKLEVELTELTPEQRAVIAGCGIRGEISLPKIVTGIDTQRYDGPHFATEYDHFEFDAVPTVEQWLTVAAERLAQADKFQPEMEAAKAAKKAAEEARKQRMAELEVEFYALQSEWLPRVANMTEDEANQPLPEHVRKVDAEARESKLWIRGSLISEAKSRRYDELVKERKDAEKSAWIAEHGSDQLRRGSERGHDCGRLYTLERSAIEAPGFTVDYYDGAGWKERSCPSAAALDEADAAEGLGIGSVKIVWLTDEPVDTKHESYDDYRSYSEPFEACEAVVISNYLGKYDLVKVV